MLEDAIYTMLNGDATLTTFVNDRIYAGKAPQGAALPLLVFRRVSADRQPHQAGVGNFVEAFMEFNCWATTNREAAQIAERVRKICDGFRGQVNGVTMDKVYISNETHDVLQPTDASDVSDHWVALEFGFWHRET